MTDDTDNPTRSVTDKPRKVTGERRPKRKGRERVIPGKPLDNPRHEAFATARAAGKTKADAYRIAGYSGNDAAKRAHDLTRSNPEVEERVQHMLSQRLSLAQVTPEVIIAGLAREAATATEGGTRTRALELLGKAHRLFVDVRENQTPGADDAEIARQMALQQLGSDQHPRFSEVFQAHLAFIKGQDKPHGAAQ
jgi:hypothetical protein